MNKQVFFLLSSIFFCINVIGMQDENSLALISHDTLYNITHHCSLQSIGRFNQTCKKFSNDDITNPYYTGRLICGIDKKSSEAILGELNKMCKEYESIACSSADPLKRVYQLDDLKERSLCFLKYFAKKKDQKMFDFFFINQIRPRDFYQLLDHAFLIHDYNLLSFLVMEKKLDISFSNYRKDNFFWFACAYNDNKTVEQLLANGANGANIDYAPGYNKETGLHCACRNKNVELVKLLIENGADVNSANVIGKTPLDIMKRKSEFKELVEALPFLEKNFRIMRNIAVPLALVVGGIGCFLYVKAFK